MDRTFRMGLVLWTAAWALSARAGFDVPLSDGTAAAARLDLTKLDLGVLGLAVKAAMSGGGGEVLGAMQQRAAEATKAGVESITFAIGDATIQQDQPPPVYIGLKAGADQAAVEKLVTQTLGEGAATMQRTGSYMLVQRTGSAPPAAAPMAADRGKAFSDAFTAAGDAPLVIVLVPTDAVRARLADPQSAASLPAPLAAMTPQIAASRSVMAALTLAPAPGLKIVIEAADESAATQVAQHVNELVDLARDVITQKAGNKATVENVQTLNTILEQFKPARSGSQVKLSLDAQALALASAVLMPAITRARESAAEQRSAENLTTLALAVHEYAGAHDGKLPDKLDDLKPFLSRNPTLEQVLRNPRTGEEVGYVYAKPGDTLASLSRTANLADTPLIYESANGKRDEKGLIAYADGHVSKPGGVPVDAPELSAGAASTEPQPLSADLDFLPPPAPWQTDRGMTGSGKAGFDWPAGGKRVLPQILLWTVDSLKKGEALPDGFAKQMADAIREQIPKGDEVTVAPEVIADPRFDAKVRYTYRRDQVLVDNLILYRRVAGRLVMITAVTDGDIDVERKSRAITRLAEDVALSIVPHGSKPQPPSVTFDLKAVMPRGSNTAPADLGPGPVKMGAVGAAAPKAVTPAREATAAPAAAPTAAPAAAPPAPAAAGSLASARQLKSTNPADAYAAFKTIVKASPNSNDGRAAAQELAAMEADPATARKVMSAEGKAYSAYSMAQNFQNSGQAEKAQQRYDQILKDFPDTMCAAAAKKKIDELKALPPK